MQQNEQDDVDRHAYVGTCSRAVIDWEGGPDGVALRYAPGYRNGGVVNRRVCGWFRGVTGGGTAANDGVGG